MTTAVPTMAAIVVHHNRHDSVGTVVRGLIDGGVQPTRLLIVDNSERPERLAELRSSVAPATVIATANRGYGAAVNAGMRALAEHGVESEAVLVATHEVELGADCIQLLERALAEDSSLVAVGPVLFTSWDGPVWSAGGVLVGVTQAPLHRTVIPCDAAAGCDWLDGALVLYRASALPTDPFDESFFLYMEEVDLHRRLALSGGRLGVVPEAHALQQSSGTPPFYFARNLRHLNRRHLSRSRRWLSNCSRIGRRALSYTLDRDWAAVRDLARGTLAPLPQSSPRIVCINPLEEALHHYCKELRSTLALAGHSADVLSTPEPSASGHSRWKWVANYWQLLRRAQRLSRSSRGSAVIVTWPVLGLLDVLLLRVLIRNPALVVHDPIPLVNAVGYGKLARLGARLCSSKVRMITHSERARADLADSVSIDKTRITLIPHPILDRQETTGAPSSPNLGVLGQFKPDRDVELLTQIAALVPPEWQLQVTGRGWPEMDGWQVESRFVTEHEFDERIRRASAILIPYKRFYQSGVAIRALELGTPVVGPRDSVLSELLGTGNAWLAADDVTSWLDAIGRAVEAHPTELQEVYQRALSQAAQGWQQLAGEMG